MDVGQEQHVKYSTFERTGGISSWYDNVDLPEWFHEPGSEEGYVAYGSTPLTPYASNVAGHQSEMRDQLRLLYDSPPIDGLISDFARSVILSDFFAGMAHRETRNYDKYTMWRHEDNDQYLNLIQYDYWKELVPRAEAGKASPAELINLMQHSSLHSTSLASLTVPYGYRLNHYPKMIHDIEGAIREYGGEVIPADKRVYRDIGRPGMHHRVEGVVGDDLYLYDQDTTEWEKYQDREQLSFDNHGLEVILVTYKRNIGHFMTDRLDQEKTMCNVVERQAVAIITDESLGFPQDVRAFLEKEPQTQKFEAGWRYVCENIIKNDVREPYLIPLSSTVYAHRVDNGAKRRMKDLQRGFMKTSSTLINFTDTQ